MLIYGLIFVEWGSLVSVVVSGSCEGVGGSYVLIGMESLWDPGRCGHWRFLVTCVSRCWVVRYRSRDVLGGGRKQVFHQDLIVFWEWGRNKEKPQQ